MCKRAHLKKRGRGAGEAWARGAAVDVTFEEIEFRDWMEKGVGGVTPPNGVKVHIVATAQTLPITPISLCKYSHKHTDALTASDGEAGH